MREVAMVGRLIRERRQVKGWSQEELADAYPTTQRQISRWEQYTTETLRKSTRDRLGELLNIKPAEWHLAAAEAVDPYGEAERRTRLTVQR